MDIVSVPGRLVRDPVTRRAVDDTPVAVDPTDPYWARLLADGDVVEAPAPAPAVPPIAAPAAPAPAPAPAPAKAAAASSQDDKA